MNERMLIKKRKRPRPRPRPSQNKNQRNQREKRPVMRMMQVKVNRRQKFSRTEKTMGMMMTVTPMKGGWMFANALLPLEAPLLLSAWPLSVLHGMCLCIHTPAFFFEPWTGSGVKKRPATATKAKARPKAASAKKEDKAKANESVSRAKSLAERWSIWNVPFKVIKTMASFSNEGWLTSLLVCQFSQC